MKCLYLILIVAFAAAMQHYVLYPAMEPLYRRNFGPMMKYSDDVINSYCGSLIGSSPMDAISIVGEAMIPFTNADEARSFQRLVWGQLDGKPRQAVFMGDLCAATDEALIKAHKITHIVNLCDKCPNKFPTLLYHNVLAMSEEHTSSGEAAALLYQEISPILQFIDNGTKNKGNILISSTRGASRSFFVAAAYLMHRHGWSLDQASAHIMSIRSSVEPSDAVLKYLVAFAAQAPQSGEPDLINMI
jgi:protein-tyrosine phosphatase